MKRFGGAVPAELPGGAAPPELLREAAAGPGAGRARGQHPAGPHPGPLTAVRDRSGRSGTARSDVELVGDGAQHARDLPAVLLVGVAAALQ
ncbi:hypothetical protein SAMN05421870_11431 [Streptomyces qinglanensis]|uniref:Uncharacterized protein n=1 Tax=Streptomyces qinglanensis TaxID=943816 RepID=A0A1H9VYA7_9ACTN|nr:hypothetical protein SAMN05421870_11431 [Streptomyces qinglanensis]